MNLLLSDIAPTQWVLLAIIMVLIIIYPVFIFIRNKKEREKFEEINASLKEGDKVLTSSGFYGEIVSIQTTPQGKLVTLKTGDEKHVGYMTVDILAIYSIVKDQQPEVEQVVEEKIEQQVEQPKEEVVEKKTTKTKVEKPKTEKNNSETPKKIVAKKSTTTKKSTTK